jgi:ATP-dependent Clp protease ATP-binding subunit ClpC
MFERFTERARRILFFARYEASQLGSVSIEPEHLLLGIAREGVDRSQPGGGRLAPFIRRLPGNLREQIADRIATGKHVPVSVEIPFAAPVKQALDVARQEADRLRDNYIGPEHLLLGLLSDANTIAGEILTAAGLDAASVRNQLAQQPADSVESAPPSEGSALRNLTAFLTPAQQLDTIRMFMVGFGDHYACTDESRRLIDEICRDLQALKRALDTGST